MKKKLGILIAVIMLVSLVFSTASMAAIDEKFEDAQFELLFSMDGLTKEDAETKIKSDSGVEAVAMVSDTESGANGQMAKYPLTAAAASHQVLFGGDAASKDASEFDGYAVRIKTDLKVNFNSVVVADDPGSTGFLSMEFRLVALDGTVTELMGAYQIEIPAGFDGYLMVGFNNAVFNGGKPAIRSGSELASGDGSLMFDLTKLKEASLVATASGDVTNKFFYAGNAYMYKLGASGNVTLPDLSASKLDCKTVIAEAKNYSGNLIGPSNFTPDSFWALQDTNTTITAADGLINVAFAEGGEYQYIHSTLGINPLNFSQGEAVAMRIKSNAAMAFWLRIDQAAEMQGLCLDVKLLSLDGKFIEAETLDGASYKVVIPKNFDGYILYYLTNVQHTGDGGEKFTKDGAFWVNGDKKYNIASVMNYVFFAQPAEGKTFSGNEVLSIEGIYVVDVNAEGGNGGGNGEGPGGNGANGAPLMIGTALTALASCAFVLKSSKKKA